MSLKTCSRLITPDLEFCFGKLKSLSRDFSRGFGFCEKEGEIVFRYLVGCCLDNTSISDYCLDHRALSADTILKLGYVSLDEMVVKCNRLLALSAKMALRSGGYRGCDVSFDYHDAVYSGERREYTIKTLAGGKLRRCYRYAVASLTGNRRFLALGVQPYKEGDTNLKMVDLLMDSTPNGFDLILMDRFFAGVDVFNRIEKRGKHFITPYKINDSTDELYRQSLLDGETVKTYDMRKKAGKWKTVYLHFISHPVDEYHAYASDLPIVEINAHYPCRWNIENLFKTKNGVKADTSTTHESWRLLLLTIELVLASLWKLLVRIKEHITVKRFRKRLHKLLEEYVLTETLDNRPLTND